MGSDPYQLSVPQLLSIAWSLYRTKSNAAREELHPGSNQRLGILYMLAAFDKDLAERGAPAHVYTRLMIRNFCEALKALDHGTVSELLKPIPVDSRALDPPNVQNLRASLAAALYIRHDGMGERIRDAAIEVIRVATELGIKVRGNGKGWRTLTKTDLVSWRNRYRVVGPKNGSEGMDIKIWRQMFVHAKQTASIPDPIERKAEFLKLFLCAMEDARLHASLSRLAV